MRYVISQADIDLATAAFSMFQNPPTISPCHDFRIGDYLVIGQCFRIECCMHEDTDEYGPVLTGHWSMLDIKTEKYLGSEESLWDLIVTAVSYYASLRAQDLMEAESKAQLEITEDRHLESFME